MFIRIKRRREPKTINLALQGGGSHGALVWGVLDRLLEDDRLVIEGISGTSSGAINGALVADGMAADGREGARQSLERFWRRIGEACEERKRSRFSVPMPRAGTRLDLTSAKMFFAVMHRVLMPYDFDPDTMDPLRAVIAEVIDFERLQSHSPVKLYINATNVLSNRMKVFSTPEVTVDAVCASSCLPFLFRPVEIAGAHYWDGGFMGNPALFPLAQWCRSRDIVLVQTGPFEIPELPNTAASILERISEVSFSSTLVREIQNIAYLNRLVRGGGVRRWARLRRINMHMIEAGEELASLKPTSKFAADWEFVSALRDRGRLAAEAWLAENYASLGKHSTVDLRGMVK